MRSDPCVREVPKNDTLGVGSQSCTKGHVDAVQASRGRVDPGVLLEDGVVPIAGRTVVFTLGTGGSAQTCIGITDATGTAACTILVNQPLGPGTVSAVFAGDAFYLPSSVTVSTIMFAFLAQGAFVLGEVTGVVGPATVEFWGFDWARQNVLSGGSAPGQLQGFRLHHQHQSARLRRHLEQRAGQQLRPAGQFAGAHGRRALEQNHEVWADRLR